MQRFSGFGVPVQDLAHHGHPLGKELLKVAVRIDAVDEGGGATGLKQLVQLPGEAAEVRVGGVAQPEDGVAQLGQRFGLLGQRQEGLRIGGRLPVAKLRGDDEQRVPVLQHAERDFIEGEDLGGEGLQGRVGGQLLGQSAGIARLRSIADHHALGDGVHVSWLGETSGYPPCPCRAAWAGRGAVPGVAGPRVPRVRGTSQGGHAYGLTPRHGRARIREIIPDGFYQAMGWPDRPPCTVIPRRGCTAGGESGRIHRPCRAAG